MPITICNSMIPVVGLAPTTTNGGADSDYTRMDRDVRMSAVVILKQAEADATSIVVYEADDADGTNAQVLQTEVPIWYDLDVSSSSVLTRADDAKNYTVSAAAKDMLVVFQLDPQYVTKPWIKVTLGDSSQATNFATVLFMHEVNWGCDGHETLI